MLAGNVENFRTMCSFVSQIDEIEEVLQRNKRIRRKVMLLCLENMEVLITSFYQNLFFRYLPLNLIHHISSIPYTTSKKDIRNKQATVLHMCNECVPSNRTNCFTTIPIQESFFPWKLYMILKSKEGTNQTFYHSFPLLLFSHQKSWL